MKIEIMHRPAYAMANIILDDGEEIVTETNSMLSMSENIELITEVRGGILKGLTRMIMGGESFFTNRYMAKGSGELNLSPRFPGDIEVIDVNGEMYLQSGAFLACESGVSYDVSWGGAQTFFSNEGLFLLQIKGSGKMLVSSYGAIYKKTMGPGEKYIVDTGHIVGFSSGMKYRVRPVGGLKQTLFSGEALVVELEGEGDIYIQTRNEDDLLSWIVPQIGRKKD